MKFVCSLAFSTPGHYCELARACEAAGFGSVAVSDHVVHPRELKTAYPYTPDGKPRWEPFTDWPDPFVAIGAMAAVTERIRFLTSILVLPMRNPFLVAKAAATAAAISDGRLDLGIGVGWMKDEFLLLDQDFHTRGKRTDEMIGVMRKLWGGGWVEHHGRFYDFEPLEMSPAPDAAIPILIGGASEAALRRAARLGDGWIADFHTTVEMRGFIERLRGYRAEAERDEGAPTVVAALSDAFDLDGYRAAADVGITHLITQPWLFYGGTTGDLPAQIEGIERFGSDVITKL